MNRVIALLVFLSIASPAAIGSDMGYYRNMVGVLDNQIKPRILDQLPRQEREELSDLSITLIENPASVTSVSTSRHPTEVQMYAGFMDGLYNYIDCVVVTYDDRSLEICDGYFDYYFEGILDAGSGPPVGFTRLMLGESKEVDKRIQKQRNDSVRQEIMMSALIHMLFHEMGHHVVGFPVKGASISDQRSLEARVDRWAVDQAIRIDENPVLGAAFALGYLAQMERFRREKEVSTFSTHPLASDRIQYPLERGCGDSVSTSVEQACDMLRELAESYE